MSIAVYSIGEIFFNVMKAGVAFDLVKEHAYPRRSSGVEKMMHAITAVFLAGSTLYNIFLTGYLFSNNLLWIDTLVMLVCVRLIYKICVLDGAMIIYLPWVMIHIIDFFIQSVVFYFLSMFSISNTVLLRMNGVRGAYLIIFSSMIILLEKKLKSMVIRFCTMRRRLVKIVLLMAATVLMVYFQRVYILVVSEQYMTIWVFFWMMLVIFAVIGAFFWQKMQVEEREKLQMVKLQLLETNYEQATRLYKEKAVLLHDEKHHINTICELLNQEKFQQAKRYAEELSEKLEQSGNRIWSNHSMMDLILNMESQKAEQEQIDLDIRFDDMEGLILKEPDICALISNLLENAIEANQKIEKEERRWIKFYGQRKGNLLIISMANPVNGPVTVEDGMVPTTKKDKRVHGFGMQSIRGVVDRYCGDMEISVEDGRFLVTIFLRGFAETVLAVEKTTIKGQKIEK